MVMLVIMMMMAAEWNSNDGMKDEGERKREKESRKYEWKRSE